MFDHKVYRNPPIAMVAVEVRHSGSDPVSEAGYSAIRKQLREKWPVQVPAQDVTLDLTQGTPAPITIDYRRFISRDRRTAIAIRPGITTVETVEYKGWDSLQEALHSAFEVRAEVSEPSGFERIGLRYINEVRIPGQGAPPVDWAPWVHSSLLGARPDDTDLPPLNEWQGLARFGPVDDRSIVVRYGPREGFAVEPNGALKRQNAPKGPFFLLDFDSFWESNGTVPEFEPGELLRRCDDLHAPVRRLFESLISTRLREEVLDVD